MEENISKIEISGTFAEKALDILVNECNAIEIRRFRSEEGAPATLYQLENFYFKYSESHVKIKSIPVYGYWRRVYGDHKDIRVTIPSSLQIGASEKMYAEVFNCLGGKK